MARPGSLARWPALARLSCAKRSLRSMVGLVFITVLGQKESGKGTEIPAVQVGGNWIFPKNGGERAVGPEGAALAAPSLGNIRQLTSISPTSGRRRSELNT